MKLRSLLTTAAFGAALAVPAVVAATPASAAPTGCTASDDEIYAEAPANLSGQNGDLLACQETKLTNIPGDVPMKAWKVRYVSTDAKGTKIPVTGTVAIPTAPWTKGGSRPTVAFNPGTLGSGAQCAFSKQLAGHFVDMYEGANLTLFLQAGDAIAATDGMGYIKGKLHPYVNGADAGHSLLDIVRASRQVPGGDLKADGKVGISGYSEGGHAALWGAQLAKSYAPELNVVGAAAGGVPGDLKLTAKQLNGSLFAGFLADALMGIKAQYPEFPFEKLENDAGRQAEKDVASNCLFGTLAVFLGAKVENFTTDKLTLDQLYQVKASTGVTGGEIIDQQKLGVDIGPAGSGAKYEIGFPVFQYRGWLEEIIPHETEDGTKNAYCKAGINTTWKNTYPTEHLSTDWGAAGDVTNFLNDRFQGKDVKSTC
ncbi:putative MT1628-like inactive lipase [Actinomadura rubteroloni]|uniref:Putative MT1628-like inactive lipase n=1 Tax=Actinomadura rubteroloni TaxID=1926885 RepID=A0A2P4UQF6_9ACTN|nr:lipase family protein [Actinomadura rubteroloni]POM27283.1 putative MT1628-like inactive lipase [Actinomadura rubteroloni]